MESMYTTKTNRDRASLLLIIKVFLMFLLANLSVVSGQDANDLSKLKQMTVREIKDTYKTNAIEKVIWKLQHEPTKESFKRLHEYTLYDWPVGVMYSKTFWFGEIPLPPSYDIETVMLILNNRRHVKLMQDLAALPKKDAAALINKELPSALKTYEKLYDSYFKNCRKGKVAGFAMSHKDKSPTLLGTKQNVLSLVMLAGHLELTETKAQVQSVLDHAVEQRDVIYNEINKDADAIWILKNASLYNRIVLGTSVLRTFVTPEKAEIIMKNSGLKYHKTKLLPYDHLPSQQYSFSELSLIDEKNGQFDCSYLEPIDDGKFDLLLSEVKEY